MFYSTHLGSEIHHKVKLEPYFTMPMFSRHYIFLKYYFILLKIMKLFIYDYIQVVPKFDQQIKRYDRMYKDN